MKGKMKTALLLGALILLAVVAIRKKEPEKVAASIVLSGVNVEAPEIGDIHLNTELIGTVEPGEMVYVIPRMNGEITGVNFEAGDVVKKGQVLCTIHSDTLTSAKIAVDSARISMNDAEKNLERMQVLFESGDVSSQNLEQLQSGYEMAKLQYNNAKTGYDLQAKYTNVLSPIDGVIESRTVEVHDMVSVQSSLFIITGKTEMQVNVQVSEAVMRVISVGEAIQVEKSGSVYAGTIIEIASMVNPASGLYEVKTTVTGGEGLQTGSHVKLTFVTERADQTILLPVSAVYYNSGKAFLYLYEDGMVKKQDIETGLYNAEYIQVLSGIDGTSQVIISWTGELYDGASVNKIERISEESVEESTTEIIEEPVT